MKTITVSDVRRRWPETEALLRVEKEIVITREAKPVAKLVWIDEPPTPRQRFDPAVHGRRQRKMAGGKVSRWVDHAIQEARARRISPTSACAATSTRRRLTTTSRS